MDGVGVLVHRTITGHMACAAANTTDDVRSEVALFWAIILAMTDTPAILTDLILIISKGAI